MNIAVICFTRNGARTALRVDELLKVQGDTVVVWCKKKEFPDLPGEKGKIRLLDMPLRQWTERMFAVSDALIFIGATGIAVRSIAPFLRSKTTDPAVIVIDERGGFVISLVSGHIGGANELCRRIACGLEAVPVITTATDLNGKFAVDVFARKNDLWISDMRVAKQISAALLDGKKAGFCSEFSWEGEAPGELWLRGAEFPVISGPAETDFCLPGQKAEEKESSCLKESGCMEKQSMAENGAKGSFAESAEPEYGICVTLDEEKAPYAQTLRLIPRIAVLGLGCRRGKSEQELEEFVLELLAKNHISLRAVEKVCSIDVKAGEEGILAFCKKFGLPFETCSARLLAETEGSFQSSSFVAHQVGVDNVCERSAVRGSGGGALVVRKTARSGMTAAVALREWRIHFE